MTIDPIQFAGSTSTAATDGVRIAADRMDFGTATETYVQTIKFGYGTEGVYNQVASGAGLPIATSWTIPVEQNSTATVPVSLADKNFTASQSTHDDLNANANLQIANVDVAAANPVWVRIAASGTATQAVAVSSHTATGPYYIDNSGTATIAVTINNTATVNINAGATMSVDVVNTATVAIANTSTMIVTQDTATDMNVTPIQGTATALNAIVRPIVARGNQTQILLTTTATTVATLATAVANTFLDLAAIHIVNSGTGAVGISIRDTSTASAWDHELAADGGGFAMNFYPPKEQRVVANAWTMALDAQPSAKVSVMMQLVQVT